MTNPNHTRAQIARRHRARLRLALSTSLKPVLSAAEGTGLAGREGSTRDPIPTPPGRCLTPADEERRARLRAALRPVEGQTLGGEEP